MKLKRLAEDFQVEEEISLPTGNGPFALYRLTKQSLSTLEAIEAIRQRWKLPKEKLAFAGLKDKHALTAQHITIHGGQRRGLTQAHFELKYLGQTPRAIHASDITANRFLIVIRDLAAGQIDSMTQSLAGVARDGLPNYFDNQRFGSVGESGQFIARPWCLGDYERALRLAIAEPNDRDRPAEREQKQVLREHWGDWKRCAQLLRRSSCDRIVAYLAGDPKDFRRAVALVPHDMRSLWLAAFQSHLWNEVLATAVSQICGPEQLTPHPIGGRDVPFFDELDDAQRQQLARLLLPLPSARIHLDDGPLKSLYDQVLAKEGLELRQIRVKYPRDSFFSKGDRAAVFAPGQLQHQSDEDELDVGRQKLTLQFTLPRGSYATILVKRIAGDLDDATEEAD